MAVAAAISVCLLLLAETAPRAEQRGPAAATPATPPRLLVLIVVDQLRADYLDQYGAQWTGGLHRMLTDGAVLPKASYPYAITRTCAGHGSISTGTAPATHGLIDNDWWDRGTRAWVACTADASASPIAFGGQEGTERHSASRLRVPALADELRRQRPSARVVSVALKARSAIALGGRGGPGSLVLWEEDEGAWSTSTAFATAAAPEVERYVRAHPQTAARGQLWNRLLPPSAYRYADSAPGEPAPVTFPRPMTAFTNAGFIGLWDMSPWSDEFVGGLGGALVGDLRLGQQADRTDMLALGFAALDYVGHNYGPRSHEVQDVLARLDRTLGSLLAILDKTVGRDHYVVALSSDHGVAVLPEQAAAVTGTPGGRVSLTAVGRAIEGTLISHFGRRPYVEALSANYAYFLPGVMERLRATPAAMSAVETAVRAVAGIERVHWADDLASTAPTTDAVLAGLRRSYVADRSGDLVFLPRLNWIATTGPTTHGTMHPYDADVPIVFYGAGIKPGRYPAARTPLDIAPTLAELAGITMPRAEGTPIADVLGR